MSEGELSGKGDREKKIERKKEIRKVKKSKRKEKKIGKDERNLSGLNSSTHFKYLGSLSRGLFFFSIYNKY